MREMRRSHPDESRLMFLVFDLLHQGGVDLRRLPLSERKRDLQTFPNGELLFEHCSKFGFEAVVSKDSAHDT